jgi:hypothetical protein
MLASGRGFLQDGTFLEIAAKFRKVMASTNFEGAVGKGASGNQPGL